MGKLQRTRGAAYEREVCDVLTKKFGTKVSRKLGQARDGGDDIEVGPLIIECKRRRGIAIYEWLDQVNKAAKDSDRLPVVVARADGRRSVAILDLEDFLALVPDDSEKDSLADHQVASAVETGAGTAPCGPRSDEVGGVGKAVLQKPWPECGTIIWLGDDGRFLWTRSLGAEAAAVG